MPDPRPFVPHSDSAPPARAIQGNGKFWLRSGLDPNVLASGQSARSGPADGGTGTSATWLMPSAMSFVPPHTWLRPTA